jgi:hypothetical protein
VWHINSITTPTGESGSIWGGLQTSVGPRALGDRLGPEGASYIVAAGDLGALTIRDTGNGGDPRTWALEINGTTRYLYRDEGQIAISVDSSNVAHLSGGLGTVSVPLLREMNEIGPITQRIIFLVSGAPSLYKAWDANPIQLMYAAGFPRSSMTNLRQRIGSAPDCCTQFMDWLTTIKFSQLTDLTDEELASWLSCALCKGFVVGAAAAAFVAVAAACIAAGPASAPAIVAVLESSSAVAGLATAGGLTISAVARMAVSVFFAAGAAAFVASIIDSICQSTGAC